MVSPRCWLFSFLHAGLLLLATTTCTAVHGFRGGTLPAVPLLLTKKPANLARVMVVSLNYGLLPPEEDSKTYVFAPPPPPLSAQATATLVIDVLTEAIWKPVATATTSFLTTTTTTITQEPPRVDSVAHVQSWARRGCQTYLHMCAAKPLRTKAVSAAVVQGIGDAFSQSLTAWLSGKPLTYDYSRTLAFMAVGCFYKGPLLHFWYGALDRFSGWWQRRRNLRDGERTLAELAVDQTVGVFLFYPLYFYAFEILSAMVQLRVPRMAVAHAKCWSMVWSVMKAQYYVWPFAQYLSFRYVPQALRVLTADVLAIFWNCYLCAQVAAG